MRVVLVLGWDNYGTVVQNVRSIICVWGFPGDSLVKNQPANAGDTGWIPRSGNAPGGGNSDPLQYSCLRNPMYRRAWQATVKGWQRFRHNWATEHTHTYSVYSDTHLPASSTKPLMWKGREERDIWWKILSKNSGVLLKRERVCVESGERVHVSMLWGWVDLALNFFCSLAE